ncbi:hypothetical protein OIU84_006103 [Salix udensis]|uniref:Uncharacterized protein n=1 Tax=Salix udensis TaxID=889485 RepID=A0AAD6JZZ6_9ROSI|nr:hypothetical protein OIU84_006103 [Salix udensis]
MNAKQQQLQDRSALIDITNDSPIVGLAMGSLETPSSSLAKQKNSRVKNNILNTPGSGEALLRGQVKTLLQKVEEEAELSKLSLENRPFLHLQGFVNSPMGLLAPTPANTPQVPDLSGDDIVLALPVIEEKLKICQEVNAEDEEAADVGGLLDELCEGISKISVKEKVMAKFEGKHTRFAYNSDDEIVEEVADCEDDDFRLKGLPTPRGKHIRFHTEE